MVSRAIRNFIDYVEEAMTALYTVQEELDSYGDTATFSDSSEHIEALEEMRNWAEDVYSEYRRVEGRRRGRRR